MALTQKIRWRQWQGSKPPRPRPGTETYRDSRIREGHDGAVQLRCGEDADIAAPVTASATGMWSVDTPGDYTRRGVDGGGRKAMKAKMETAPL